MPFGAVFNHTNMIGLLSQYIDWKDFMNVREVFRPFYVYGVLRMPKMVLIRLARIYFADAQYDVKCPDSMLPRSIAYYCLTTFNMPVLHIAKGHVHAVNTFIDAFHNKYVNNEQHPRKSSLNCIHKKNCDDAEYTKIINISPETNIKEYYDTSNERAYCFNLSNDPPMFVKMYEYLVVYWPYYTESSFKHHLAKAHRFDAINELFAFYGDMRAVMANGFIQIAIHNNDAVFLRWLYENKYTADADFWDRNCDYVDLYTYMKTHNGNNDGICEWGDIVDTLIDVYRLPYSSDEWIQCATCVNKFMRAGYKISDADYGVLAMTYTYPDSRIYALIESYVAGNSIADSARQ